MRTYWGRRAAGLLVRCDDDGTVLMVRRSLDQERVDHPGTWSVPGGAVVDGWATTSGTAEDPADELWLATAVREAKEELGTAPRFKVVDAVTFRDGAFAYRTYVVGVSSAEKERIDRDLSLNAENEEAGWFLPTDPPSPLHFGARWVLDNSVMFLPLRSW